MLFMQELQVEHRQVMCWYAEGRSKQELAELAQRSVPLVQTWLQVRLLGFCVSCPVSCCMFTCICIYSCSTQWTDGHHKVGAGV